MSVRLPYLAMMVVLLAVEILIALFVHDRIVRPFIGDSLAVMLVYCALRAMTRLRERTAVATALVIAVAIEVGQLVGVLDLLGLRTNGLATMLLGTGFDPTDFLAYGGGALCAMAAEAIFSGAAQARAGRVDQLRKG